MSAETHVRQRPEPSAVNGRAVAAAIVGAIVLIFATIFVSKAIYDAAVPVKPLPPPQTFPQPRVDTSDAALLHRLTAEQRAQLDAWRWANAEHTLVQIPIERAMQIVARKGADAYGPLLAPQPALSSPQAGAERVITPVARPASAPAAASNGPAPGAKAAAGTPEGGPSATPPGSAGTADLPVGAPPHGSEP